MRNVKKFLALVLAMLMVVSAAATVSAFEDVADDHVFAAAINDLTVKEIVNGYDGETFGPDDAVTRQQMALMMARAITGNVGDDAVWAQGGLVGFEDVTEYQYAIATVVKAGIVDGFLDNTFRPEEGITFVQALKMAVCALGYDDGNLEWWNGYYNVALDLGLTENLNYITDADKALNRGEVAQLIYNMLYVELADGSDCFASQNFGLATSENVTTFVITATDEQTAAEGMDVTEGGYVGLQQLVNGVPEGDVCYVPVEMLGFEEDEDEEYFLHAFNVVNWDAETATFDQIIPTGNSWKIYNTEVSSIKNNKFTYESKNYYPVDELTGTAIKNEVVLFSAVDYGYNASNLQLFLNKDGQVLDEEGDPILEAVYAVNGDIVSYRAIRSTLDGKVTKGEYLSVAKATALYGAPVGSVVVPYTTMEETDLVGAYELTAFDDDLDGKMDRAYWTPVYVSVYEGINSSKVHQTAGPLKDGKFDDDDGKVTGMEDLVKGDVFVYTFNEQLREVTVLEVLEVEQGTVKKVNTTKKATDGYSTITLTDGTALTIYTTVDKTNPKLGANIQATDAVDYTETDWIAQLNSGDYDFGLVDDTTLLKYLEAGSLIRYYARNNVILFAETYDIDEVFERVVLKEVIDADLEAVYLDVYKNGEVEEIAVTAVQQDDKIVELAEMSWIKISKLLNDLMEDLDSGKVYRISELENGYQLSEVLDDVNGTNADDFKLVLVGKLDADKALTDTPVTADIVIEDNIAVKDANYDKANRLRTDEDTIWYFIEEGKVKVFSGELNEATIDVVTNTRIYADKLGYSGDNKGVATEVYVFNAGDDTVGFGWNDEDYSVVYISTAITDTDEDYYEQGDAEDVGLNPKDYDGRSYYKYSSSFAIDMYSGAATSVYSEFALKAGKFYYVNEDGMIVGTHDAPKTDKVVEATDICYEDIEFADRYISIDGELDYDYEVKKIYALSSSAKTDSIKKTESAIDDLLPVKADGKNTYKTVYILAGYDAYDDDKDVPDDDGIFVVIVGATKTAEVVEGVANGYWYIASAPAQDEEAGKRVVANTLTADTDMTIKGDIKLYAEFGTTGDDYDTKGAVSKTNLSDTSVVSVLNFKKWDASEGWVDVTEADLGIKVTVKDGTITVTKLYYADKPATEVELEAGAEYRLAIEINGTAANADTVLKMRAEFAVPAAE